MKDFIILFTCFENSRIRSVVTVVKALDIIVAENEFKDRAKKFGIEIIVFKIRYLSDARVNLLEI